LATSEPVGGLKLGIEGLLFARFRISFALDCYLFALDCAGYFSRHHGLIVAQIARNFTLT
jgi:hypothetical protein